ncbi:MAG: VOC family protein [Thaumarchaeota archaeon]|nr:VOC family protein [Nitrososphaerota archaeon]
MIKDCNVTVMVSDMNPAVQFYVEALGLKLKARYGEHFAQLDAPGTTIALHPAGQNVPKRDDSGNLSIGFEVDDIAAEVASLKAKGVIFRGEISSDGPVKLAFFSDPDGNPLYLSQKSWR